MEFVYDSKDKVTVVETDSAKKSFISGRCLHNYKFASVFVPCVIPLLYAGGNLLLGVSVFCIFCVYLVGHVSRQRKSTTVAYVISIIVLQFTVVYSLLPFIWKSLFNVGLVFIYNVFLVLSGGVGLLQSKQMQIEEPAFIVYLEYILFVAYPITGQFVMTSVIAVVIGWWSAPFSCILFGFLFVQVFIVPSQSSFVYDAAVHRTGQQSTPTSEVIGPMEKTLLLFNLLSIPGSMFIIMYIMEFYKLITWVQLLCCGSIPVFLCTCIHMPDVVLFLDLYPSSITRVRYLSGIASMLLVWVLCWSSRLVTSHSLAVLSVSALVGLVVGLTAKSEHYKMMHQVSLFVSVIFYTIGIWLYVGNVISLSMSMLLLVLGLSVLTVLCAASIYFIHNRSIFSTLLVVLSAVLVLCEFAMLEQNRYSIHWLILTASITFYTTLRLWMVDLVHWQAVWLCWSLHASKLSPVLHAITPHHIMKQGYLLPGVLSHYRPFVCIMFSLFILKVLIFSEERYFSFKKGVQLCSAIGVAVVLVYDSVVLPVWLVITNQWPSGADVAACVILIWGLLCLRVSLVQLSNNLDAKRLNVILLCVGVFVQLFQLEFSPSQVISSIVYYSISLVYRMDLDQYTEDTCVHWMLLVSFIISLALLVKLVRLENTSDRHQVLLCTAIGLPVGLKIASLFFPLQRPVFLFLCYGLSSSLCLFLILSSWTYSGENVSYRGYSFVGIVVFLFVSILLESSMHKEKRSTTKNTGYSSQLYFMGLYLILGLCLKKQQVQTKESLEDNKGKVSLTELLLSYSSLANVSVVFACILATWCYPGQYWELWISLCSSMLLLWRSEGLLCNIQGSLLASVFLVLCMYIGTIITALPVRLALLPVFGFIIEMLVLHGCLPSYYGLFYSLFKKNITLPLQQAVVFCGPLNVILLVYCSTISGRILGTIGVLATYWIFYYVECLQ